MQPTLQPGDRLLVFQWTHPVPGDVVVVRDPEQHLSFIVKRVARVAPNGDLELRGDQPNVSRDSRHFGLVAARLVVGSVFYRYQPAERRGRLASSG